MNSTQKRIKSDRKSTDIIVKEKNSLIADGLYPDKFSKPISLQLELTGKCNLNCKHCYNRSGRTHINDDVTPEKWIEFCKKLVSRGGILQATISGGEPLLLGDKLWKIMDILHNDGTIFNFISNGFLFSDNVLKHLKKYRFYWIQISIDNYVSRHHDEFRGMNGSWRKAAEAAYKVALSGIPLRIATTITPKDIHNLENFVQMAINLGASYYVIGEVIPSGRAYDNRDILLSEKERDIFYEEIQRLTKKYRQELSILVSGSQRIQLEYSSSGPIDGAIIRPNGNIRLDCSCPFVIGNILKDDIFTVWSEKYNCWQHPTVKEYISRCDPVTGENSFIQNYNQEDIVI